MKKLLLIASIAFISINANAQVKGSNEISLGAGIFTTNGILDLNNDIISSLIGDNTTKNTKNKTSTPAYNLTYKYAIKDQWLIFGDITYQNFKSDIVENKTKIGTLNQRNFTFGIGTEYHYISKENFQIYSGGSIALTRLTSDYSLSKIKDEKDNYFNFHVNAVGFRFGKKLGVFAELGFGYKGIGNLGISYQF